jgi:hypothetical protein
MRAFYIKTPSSARVSDTSHKGTKAQRRGEKGEITYLLEFNNVLFDK